MSEQEQIQAVRDTYFVEARCHWDKHHTQNDGTQPISPNGKYVQLDGGRDPRGAVHQPVWPKIVKFAWQHGVDPTFLIRSVFANRNDRQLPPANMFISRAALEACQRYQGEHAVDVEYEFKTFRRAAGQRQWELEQTIVAPPNVIWRLVIVDPMLGYGPLYRYCLALEFQELDLVNGYRHNALLEYVKSPDEFDKVMGQFLPDDFKAEGRRLREKFKHG